MSDDLNFGFITSPLSMVGEIFDALLSDDLGRLKKAPVRFAVTGPDGKPAKDATIALIHESGNRFIAQLPADGRNVVVPVGHYRVNVITRGARPAFGSRDIVIPPKTNEPQIIAASFEFIQNKRAPFDDSVHAGSQLSIARFDGATSSGSIVVRRGQDIISSRSFDTWPVDFAAPPMAGDYKVDIMACAPVAPLVSWPLIVKESNIHLVAAANVPAGSAFPVRWEGEGARGDLIGLRDAASKRPTGPDFIYGGDRELPVSLVAPFEPGHYEIIYRSPVGPTVLASRPIEVERAEIKIVAPDTTEVGAYATIRWPSGAANQPDLGLYREAAAGGLRVATLERPGENRLLAPPGRYELRLTDASGVRTSRPIQITPSELFSTVPRKPAPGTLVRLQAARSLDFSDMILIVPSGTKDIEQHQLIAAHQENDVISIEVPALAGRYAIVWLAEDPSTQEKVAITQQPIDMSGPDGLYPAITAPDKAGLLEPILVSWPDPDDYEAELWPRSNRTGSKPLRRFRHASQTSLAISPGTYDLRLRPKRVDGTLGPVTASRPIVVMPGKILVDVAATVAPGTTLAFKIAGTPAFGDRVSIRRSKTQKAGPSDLGIGETPDRGEIRVPIEPGHYELVYLASFENSLEQTVLDRVPFTVK